MMDYYEELGVDRSASPEEIRQAYRHLVRLLHPDRCSDEAMRQVAALQMRRLNAVLHILTNPAERDRYDLTLVPLEKPEMCARPPHRGAPAWLWPALGTILLAGVTCSLMRVPQIPVPDAPGAGKSPVTTPTTPVREAPVQGARLPRPSPAFSTTSGRKVVVSGHTSARPVVPASLGLDAPVEDPEPVSVATLSAEVAPLPMPPVPAPHAGGKWAGEWLFAASHDSQNHGWYPPEYIELRLAEDSGVLRGRYRARYVVSDKAISPAVTFEFEGPPGEKETKLPWAGDGGAKGEVTLHLLPNGTMEVTWVATQLGRSLNLISGTATLIRKAE